MFLEPTNFLQNVIVLALCKLRL